jgi:hypothetical protein
MISIACLSRNLHGRAILTTCMIAANIKTNEHAPAWALSRISVPCQVSMFPKISSIISHSESLERRILTAFLQTATYQDQRGRRKLSASKTGLDRRMESPRAGRSGAKSESCRSTTPERLLLRVGRENTRDAVSHEPSCPSRLHVLHHGASTQTTLPGVSKDFGQAHS